MLVYFVLNNLVVLIFGFYVLALIAIIVWKGWWKILPAIPTAAMSVILINIYVGTRIDPTSHNLWPFEILFGGGACLLTLIVLTLLGLGLPKTRKSQE
ncbi:hypothetical protein ACFL00_01630 [Pseudomonadota bacterium]